ncbi:MAG: cytidylyltransferase domain-containing protein [Gemmatimonadaceae bacterium]
MSTRAKRVVSIIEARFASTRLPGKVLMPILGEPMLARMIERLRRATTIDALVVATSTSPADDAVAETAARVGAETFRGSEEDVLARVVGAARTNNADIIAEVTGDCPLHDPKIVDAVVRDYLNGGADFVSNIHPYTTPRGTDVRVFSADALAEIERASNDPADREHVSLHFWEHPEKYRLRNVAFDFSPRAAQLRLTVDTAKDLELVTAIYEELYPRNHEFTIEEVMSLLEQRPDLAAINANVEQKAVR